MKKLRYIPVQIMFFVFISYVGFGQESKVKNIDIDISGNKVFINYDLIQKDTFSANDIELFFVDNRFTVKVPEKLSGDIGSNIKPGQNKRIEWDVFNDDVEIAQKLKPRIIVNGIKKGGPQNALYSILIPGLGDYFVKDHKDMIIKPYYRTLATFGVIGLSVMASQNRERINIISEETQYVQENGLMVPSTRTYVSGYYYEYWMFKGDAEVFLVTGIAMWIGDIVWVYAKGNENDRLRMFSNFSLNGYVGNGLTNLSLSYSF